MAKAAERHSRHYRGEDACVYVLDGDYKMGPSEGYRNKMGRRRVHTRPMYEQECIAKVIGGFAVPDCSGGPTVHEPWTRGRGGPIDDPANMVPMCAHHNTWVSQDVEGQRWAEANDLLIHAWEGPTWLEAGGVHAPKGWRSLSRSGERPPSGPRECVQCHVAGIVGGVCAHKEAERWPHPISADRKPLPPHMLVDALQDAIHVEMGETRRVKAKRIRRI